MVQPAIIGMPRDDCAYVRKTVRLHTVMDVKVIVLNKWMFVPLDLVYKFQRIERT